MRGLVTGSFDPITLGHMDIIKVASCRCSDLTVCMFVNEEKDYYFSAEERLELIRLALTDYPNVKINSSDGMVYEYCKDNNFDCIYRGFRNSVDYEYETLMSEYNHTNCGINTHLIPSTEEYINISSTKIKEMIDKGEDWSRLVPKMLAETIKAYIGRRR